MKFTFGRRKHFFLLLKKKIMYCMSVFKFHCKWGEKVKVLVAQLCPALCLAMDRNPLCFSVNGIPQARILEWVAIPFSRGSFQLRDGTWASCIAGGLFTFWATREALWYHLYMESKIWYKWTYLWNRLTDIENKLTKGERGSGRDKLGAWD